MAKTQAAGGKSGSDAAMVPVVAATLAGVIYQARLLNRQSKLNIPEDEVIRDVVGLWRTIMDELGRGTP